MSQHTPQNAASYLSAKWREPLAHRLTSEDLIALSASHDRWRRRYGWLCFALGAGFGTAAAWLAVSLWRR